MPICLSAPPRSRGACLPCTRCWGRKDKTPPTFPQRKPIKNPQTVTMKFTSIEQLPVLSSKEAPTCQPQRPIQGAQAQSHGAWGRLQPHPSGAGSRHWTAGTPWPQTMESCRGRCWPTGQPARSKGHRTLLGHCHLHPRGPVAVTEAQPHWHLTRHYNRAWSLPAGPPQPPAQAPQVSRHPLPLHLATHVCYLQTMGRTTHNPLVFQTPPPPAPWCSWSGHPSPIWSLLWVELCPSKYAQVEHPLVPVTRASLGDRVFADTVTLT